MSRVEYQRAWRRKNPDKCKQYSKRNWQQTKNNPETMQKIAAYKKQWKKDNRQKHLDSCYKYKKTHPEKNYQHQLNYVKKHGFGSKGLKIWAIIIKSRDKYKCQVCSKTATVAHHIFHKAKYPKMMFITNNGISLCDEHHLEAHGWRMG